MDLADGGCKHKLHLFAYHPLITFDLRAYTFSKSSLVYTTGDDFYFPLHILHYYFRSHSEYQHFLYCVKREQVVIVVINCPFVCAHSRKVPTMEQFKELAWPFGLFTLRRAGS